MKARLFMLAALVLSSCPEPAKPPVVTPPVATVTPPPVATETAPKPTATPTPPPTLAPGTRTVLAEKKIEDSWDKMIVAGGRLYALTDVNKWTSGPMYVPAARLWSVPIAGGELTKHLELEGLASLAADDASLYVAVARDLAAANTGKAKAPTGRIFRLPLGGASTNASPTNLATAIEPNVLAVDGDTLWFDGSRMPKDGSKPPSPSGVKGALAFAFDDENVYFTRGKGSGETPKPDGKNGRVMRLSKKGGAPAEIASGLPDEPGGLAVDATHVYVAAVGWSTPAAERAGVIARVPKQGGPLETLAADQPALRAAWLSGEHFYVRSGRPGRPGSILRVAKGGGAVETVVSDDTLVHATMDATSIYFSNDGKVRMEPFERLAPAVVVRLVK
jgi:hypothetical protein